LRYEMAERRINQLLAFSSQLLAKPALHDFTSRAFIALATRERTS
jgi:hypothetical protein